MYQEFQKILSTQDLDINDMLNNLKHNKQLIIISLLLILFDFRNFIKFILFSLTLYLLYYFQEHNKNQYTQKETSEIEFIKLEQENYEFDFEKLNDKFQQDIQKIRNTKKQKRKRSGLVLDSEKQQQIQIPFVFQTIKDKKQEIQKEQQQDLNIFSLQKELSTIKIDKKKLIEKDKTVNSFGITEQQTHTSDNISLPSAQLFSGIEIKSISRSLDDGLQNNLFNKKEEIKLKQNQVMSQKLFEIQENQKHNQIKEESPISQMSEKKNQMIDLNNLNNSNIPIRIIQQDNIVQNNHDERQLETPIMKININEQKPQEKQDLIVPEARLEISELQPEQQMFNLIKIVNLFFEQTKQFAHVEPRISKNLKQQTLVIFSKLCLDLDQHFMQRVEDFNQLLQQHQDNDELYLFIVREIIMKIFLDLRTRFKSCKIVIFYYSCLLHLINISHPRMIDLALGIIFRKLGFLINDTALEKDFWQKQDYEIFGIQVSDDSQIEIEHLEVLESYFLFLLAILGVEEKLLNDFAEKHLNKEFKNDYKEMYLSILYKINKTSFKVK